jgi:hypothetical protein
MSPLVLAILLACLLAVSGRALAAQTGPKDLGPPSYSGYCQHLGFVDARLTPQPNQQWVCLHADSSTSPMDLQAACEFSYAPRPISATQLTPGVAFTWQCLQTSAAGPGPGLGGPGSQPAPTSARLRLALLGALTPTGRRAKIGALLRAGGYSARFGALSAGTLTISWYFVPKGARVARAKPKPTLVASGRARFSAPGTLAVKIQLTARGRQLLRHAKRLKITAKGGFTQSAALSVSALATFTLRR